MTSKPIFISYSHDSEAHRKRVLALSERLRADGIETTLDRYVEGTPKGGWPRWMRKQARTAEFVLVICTETYYKRFWGDEEVAGRGVDWEGTLITQEIYEAHSRTVKFVPVLLDPANRPFVPEPLAVHTVYVLESEASYRALCDFLLGQSGIEPGRVGAPQRRPQSKGEPATFGDSARPPSSKPIHLPYPSVDELFKGREELLTDLRTGFAQEAVSQATPIAVKVLHGLGGVGKTRTAVEYAWRNAANYSAVLFVEAESAEALHRNLATLAGPLVLDLPEQQVPDEEKRQAAVLRWLRDHPGWLLILDNLDTAEAAGAAQDLLPDLHGGHVLLTGRISTWSGQLAPLGLDVLSDDAATEFLLARTATRRRKAPDDAAMARTLAARLGGLALALEQAGAYIAHQRLTFSNYLEAWDAGREKVLSWYDPRVMQYPTSLAVTWQTSFERLSEGGRRLLQRISWLAAEPIPESLLDVPLPGEEGFDAREALADLERYSLVTRAVDAATFFVHRLVQEVSRPEMGEGLTPSSLLEALIWINEAFAGDPDDVRSWPTLDPLAPHARAAADHADSAGVREPTSRLFSQLGFLLHTKARLAEAEPLERRALAIDEQNFGPDHPAVAIRLSNLAVLLRDTNRSAEAEPLVRRALAIDEESVGPDHPKVAIRLSILALLLSDTNRLAEAEPLMRRALAIVEQNFGPDHPKVAICLSNLGNLLKATNRSAEAEALIGRALAIDEQSLGPDHPSVAVRLNNLATIFKDTNRLAEAETLMTRALAINEKSYGLEHPRVAWGLANLALILEAGGRAVEAAALRQRARSIWRKEDRSG